MFLTQLSLLFSTSLLLPFYLNVQWTTCMIYTTIHFTLSTSIPPSLSPDTMTESIIWFNTVLHFLSSSLLLLLYTLSPSIYFSHPFFSLVIMAECGWSFINMTTHIVGFNTNIYDPHSIYHSLPLPYNNDKTHCVVYHHSLSTFPSLSIFPSFSTFPSLYLLHPPLPTSPSLTPSTSPPRHNGRHWEYMLHEHARAKLYRKQWVVCMG